MKHGDHRSYAPSLTPDVGLDRRLLFPPASPRSTQPAPPKTPLLATLGRLCFNSLGSPAGITAWLMRKVEEMIIMPGDSPAGFHNGGRRRGQLPSKRGARIIERGFCM